MRKVLFLDIDGVCNSVRYMKSGAHRPGSMLGIDPYPAFMVGKIQLDTGCEVVLSSTWRLNKMSRDEVRHLNTFQRRAATEDTFAQPKRDGGDSAGIRSRGRGSGKQIP